MFRVVAELHTICERHFGAQYDEKYAATYGRYRLERIQQIGERFCTCGDYLQGVARIRCTNPECGLVGAFGTCSAMHPGHDYFRPFSCKGFSLCPPCSRKRTILFAEHLTNEVLRNLPHRQPHRQFVFIVPKARRPFFRHDRRLFADVSRLIYRIIDEFYAEAAVRPLLTGMVIAPPSFGDPLRWNPHFHAGCMAEQQSTGIATRPGCMAEQHAQRATRPGRMGEQFAKRTTSASAAPRRR